MSAEGRYPYPTTRKTSDSGAKSYPGKLSQPTSRSSGRTLYSSFRRTTLTTVDERQWTLKTVLRPFLRVALFFNVMVLLCLVLVLIFSSVETRRGRLKFRRPKLPLTISFDEVAVVSNSDVCNEVARFLLSDGHSMFALAFAMQFCMIHFENHRGGLGGQSSYVYVENGNCTTFDTFRLDEDEKFGLWNIIDETAPENRNARNASECFRRRNGKRLNDIVAPPSEIVVLKKVYEKIPAHERVPLLKSMRLYLLQARLFGTLPLRVFFDIYKDFLSMSGALFYVGKLDMTLLISEAGEETQLDWDSIITLAAYRVNPLCTGYEKDFNQGMKIFWETIENEEKTRKIGNGDICISEQFRDATMKFRNITGEGVTIGNDSYYASLQRNTRVILYGMRKFLSQMRKERKEQHHTQDDKEKEEDMPSWKNAHQQKKWTSNMFVIVNRTSQSAFAYEGTLGSGYGSGSFSKQGILNDLREFAFEARNLSGYEDGIHRLLPLIMTSHDGQIQLAYANAGGGILVSRAIPRLLYTVALQGRSGTMDHVLVSPMAFLDTAKQDNLTLATEAVFLDGIEHLPHYTVIQQHRVGKTEIDESVVIEVRDEGPGKQSRRMYASHADVTNGRSIMPAGI